MKRILLDSGIVSDFVNRRRDISSRIREHVAKGIRVGTCLPVVAEIMAGIEMSQSRERNLKAFLAALPSLTVWPFDEAAAFRYGKIFSDLKKSGRPMQVIDIMVASVALTLGDCKVVTTDSDLVAIPGLNVEIW